MDGRCSARPRYWSLKKSSMWSAQYSGGTGEGTFRSRTSPRLCRSSWNALAAPNGIDSYDEPSSQLQGDAA